MKQTLAERFAAQQAKEFIAARAIIDNWNASDQAVKKRGEPVEVMWAQIILEKEKQRNEKSNADRSAPDPSRGAGG